ncbi:MAG: hypothetical protein KUL74_03220 [Cloacibacterium sp.]|nr:hypothetical protein [Cloacibacterium sp.]
MDNKTLAKYLKYFSQNKVDLSDKDVKKEIGEIFGWQEFLKNFESLEKKSLIIENNDRNSYSITEKGKTTLKEIESEIESDNQTQEKELESLTTSVEVNKFLIRTKWLPHIIALLSLFFSIYTYFDARNDSKKLETRIHKLENRLINNLNK